MDNELIMKQLESVRIIPVIAIDSNKDALPLADVLISGGLPVAEITFRTAAALDVIKTLAKERPQLLVGAGTVLSVENLEKALAAGAKFGVAPGLNEKVVKRAKELGIPFIPGVATPTEIESAMQLGCKVLKFFPAGVFGGLKALSAISGPYVHTGVRFVPTGGVNLENLQDYLTTKSVFAVGGTWLAAKDDIKKGDWSTITERCRQAVEIRDAK